MTRYGIVPAALYQDDRLGPTDRDVYAALATCARRQGDWVVFPAVETIATQVDRGIRTVRYSLRRLTETGWITPAGRRHRRSKWRVNLAAKCATDCTASVQPIAHFAADTPLLNREEEQNPPTPQGGIGLETTSAAMREDESMTRRQTKPPNEQPALLVVDEPVSVPTANDLTRAWCAAYSEAREGRTPQPSVVKRIGRTAKSIAADCETIDHWRVAWRAFAAAGKAGRYDVLPYLIDDQPRSLYPVKQSPGAILRESRAARRPLFAPKAIEE